MVFETIVVIILASLKFLELSYKILKKKVVQIQGNIVLLILPVANRSILHI